MAIATALCARDQGLAFGELKRQCGLTDGNLNRHLLTLQNAAAVRLTKRQEGARAVTVIHMTQTGREQFLQYLKALEDILKLTANELIAEESIAKPAELWNLSTLAP